jgi:GT2 family glycosyltransferase
VVYELILTVLLEDRSSESALRRRYYTRDAGFMAFVEKSSNSRTVSRKLWRIFPLPETRRSDSKGSRMNAPGRWEISQVKLDQPLGPMSLPRNAAGGYIVFWWHDIPLGHAIIQAAAFPLNKADLQRRASRAIAPAIGDYWFQNGLGASLPFLRQDSAHNAASQLESLAVLGRNLENLASHETSVSVIVCTRRRPERLKRCLASLRQLDPSPTEIVVADNAPEDRSTLDVVEAFDGVIYCPEPTVGLSRARNSGILRSSGEIVAFTDDDVVVHPRWLLGIRQALSRANVLGMTGLVLAAELETDSQIRFEFDTDGFNRGYRPITFDSVFFKNTLSRGVPVWRIGAGANMAFRREVFSGIGLFDERLGAGAAGCSEDSEFWYRMLATGMSIAYEPRSVVWHSHRSDRGAFRSQMKQYMRGHVAALLVQFEKHRHVGNLQRLLFALPSYYLLRLKRTVRKGDWWLLFDELLGYVSGFVSI